MKFNNLSIRNFLSFGETAGVGGFNSLPLRRRGLVLIEGENRDDASAKSNGAGKTSVVDALLWCLFGITTRGYENDDVVNNRVGKDCTVALDITHDGRHITVARARQDSLRKNTLVVAIDGIDVSKGSTKDTQDYLESLLDINAQTFLNSVVFGQTPGYRFSRLTDKQQKDVLDDALGIDQYARACELARTKLKEVKALREAQEVKLEEATQQRDTQEETLAELLTKHKDFKRELVSEGDTLDKALAKQRARRTELKDVLTKHAEAAARKTEAVELRKRARTAAEDAALKVADAKANTKALAQRVADLDKRIAHEEEKLRELRTGDEDRHCDECGQEVTAITVADLIARLKKERKRVHNEMTDAEGDEELWRATQREAATTLVKLDKTVDTLTEEATAYAQAEREDAAAKTIIRGLKERIEALETKESPYKTLIDKAETRLGALKTTIAEAKAAVKAHAATEAVYAYWTEAFGTKGLRAFLIDTALPFLNDRAAEYTRVLTDGNIEIRFKTVGKLKTGKDVERFEVEVINAHGAHSYRGNSAGESGKIDLCVGLALQALVASRAGARANVAFFDEPFEHIDEEGVERVIELLDTATKAHESVFVVTHNEALKAYFPDTLKIIKEGGFSRIE